MVERRLGLLVPSSNTVMEVDFYRHLPASVTLHTARMYLEDVTVAAEKAMMEEYATASARDLATVEPDLVVFGCTSASAVYGVEGDSALRGQLASLAGAPVIGVMASAVQAIRQAGGTRVAVVTPYIDEISERVAGELTRVGLDVVAVHGLGIVANTDIGRVAPDEIAAFVRRSLATVDADCVFVSCTNFRAMECLDGLRDRFKGPVITSNQAALGAALGRLALVGADVKAEEEGAR